MADNTASHALEHAGGQLLKPINRRDVLKLAALFGGSLALAELYRIYQSPIVETDMMEGQTSLHENEQARLQSLGSKLVAIQSVASLNGGLGEETVQPLRDKFGIDNVTAAEVHRFETENGFGVGDVGVVISAISSAPLKEETKAQMRPILDVDSKTAFDLVANSSMDGSFWEKLIVENDLVLPILNQGTRGRNALLRIGIDNSLIGKQDKVVASLLTDTGKLKNIKSDCVVIENTTNPHNSTAIIDDETQGTAIYSFDRSRKTEEIKWATFILNNLSVITDKRLSQQDYDSLQVKEFIIFQTWVYDYYREKLSSNPKMTLGDFYLGIHDDLINETKYPKDHFIEKMKSIEADYSTTRPKEYRYSSLTSATNWNIQQFAQVIESLSPKTRSMFHEKKSQLKEPRTYQMILTEASEDGLTREKIIMAVKKYAGNLYLEPIGDRISSDADIKANTEKNRYDPDKTRKDILSGELTLIDYADMFFSESRKFVFSDDGKVLGVVVKEKVAEPIEEIPGNVLSVLRAVEGEDWIRGGDFIKTLVLRNIIAKFNKNPESGASSPEMTILESILPGPFDRQNALRNIDRKEYPFRRTDLYGKGYLKKLYEAYRDGKSFPEIYKGGYLNSPMSPKDPVDNVWNRLCSKFETAILARDFSSHFGKDELVKIFFKYVPLGSAALGSEGGIPIYGLETGAKYLFKKKLGDLNSGEIAILIGMISAPNAYGPKKFNGKEWVDNIVDCKERAQTVARLCKGRGGFDVDKMLKEIENAEFKYYIDPLWTTTFSEKEMNDLANRGILNTSGVNLGSGIGVIRMNEAVPLMPEIIGMPRYASPEQRDFDDWMSGLIKAPNIELVTDEQSDISAVYKGATDIIANLDFSDPNWKYDMAYKLANYAKKISYDSEFTFITSKTVDGKVDKNRNPYNKHTSKYDLYNFLYEAENTETYQCGQLALVLNALYRIKNNSSMPPLGSGNVDSWVANLFEEAKPGQVPEHMQTGHEMFLLDVINNPVTAIDYINVGDMVIGWAGTVTPTEYWIGGRQKANTGSGHVATVINKGVDSQGRSWIEVLDANYLRRGDIRRQIIWGNKNMSELLFPGNSKNFAVIRKAKIDHGSQVQRGGSDFIDSIFTFRLNDKDLAIPAMEQKLDVGDGIFVSIKTPGVAVSVFDRDGFVKSFDKTNVLSSLPVMAGNPIRMFLHAFLKHKGVDTEQKINVSPGKYALDGSDIEVRNATSARMNTDKAAEISLDMALAGSFDVPHQKVFKEMLDKDPNVWSEFQRFLDIFGIPLVNWDGSILDKPTALAATGQDAYIMNTDKLGYAISSFLNMNKFDNLALIPGIKEACDKTAVVILDQERRKNLKLNAFPIIESLGSDVHDQGLSNATVDITTPDGASVVFIGTRSPFIDTGVLIDPKSGRVTVGVSQSGFKEVKSATLYRRAGSMFDYGFIDLLRSIV